MRGISVVICSHNGSQRIAETLSHLKRQVFSIPINWEVILVDNASTDHLAEVANHSWDNIAPLRIVSEPKLGVGNARMTGLREVKFSYIAFVDDDNHLAPDWVQTAFDLMEQYPDAGAIGGLNEAVFESTPPVWFSTYQANYAVGPQAPADGEIQQEHLVLWTAGMVLRKAAWDDLIRIGFKPILVSRTGNKLLSGEDSEICYMLRLSGWKLYYFSHLKMEHVMPAGRLTWNYLCRLKYALGATSLFISIYRRLYHTAISGETITRKSWQRELFADAWQILRQPAVLGAAMLGLYQGNHRILQMHSLLGRFTERLRLLKRLHTVEDELWQKYAPLLSKNLSK